MLGITNVVCFNIMLDLSLPTKKDFVIRILSPSSLLPGFDWNVVDFEDPPPVKERPGKFLYYRLGLNSWLIFGRRTRITKEAIDC